MVKWAILIVVGVLTFISSYLYVHLGIYKNVELLGKKQHEFHLLYKIHVGPYHKINDTLKAVETWAYRNNINCPQTFGEYLDDPEKKDMERLKSYGGCVTQQEVTGELPDKLKYEHRPKKNYLQLQFKGAPSIAPYKVYPKARSWLEKSPYTQVGPIIEVYEVKNRDLTTTYYFPVEHEKEQNKEQEQK